MKALIIQIYFFSVISFGFSLASFLPACHSLPKPAPLSMSSSICSYLVKKTQHFDSFIQLICILIFCISIFSCIFMTGTIFFSILVAITPDNMFALQCKMHRISNWSWGFFILFCFILFY